MSAATLVFRASLTVMAYVCLIDKSAMPGLVKYGTGRKSVVWERAR